MVLESSRLLESSPLHDACARGGVDAVENMLSTNAKDVNALNENGLTPLHVAVLSNDWPVVEDLVNVLLFHGARINATSAAGRDTPLHVLLAYGKLRAAERTLPTMLRNGALPDALNDNMSTPIHIAQANNYIHLAKLMDDFRRDPRAVDRWEEEMERLRNTKPGRTAFQPGRGETMDTARSEDTYAGNVASPVNETSRQPPQVSQTPREVDEELIRTIIAGNIPMMNNAISRGANVNYQTMLGYYPVHYVVGKRLRNTMLMLDVLEKKGAVLNATTEENDSCITLAIKKQANEDDAKAIVQYLMNKGVDTTIRDQDGQNALELAERFHYYEIFSLLKGGNKEEKVSPSKSHNDTTDPNEFSGKYHTVHIICRDTKMSWADAKVALDDCFAQRTRIDLRTKEENETCLHIAARRAHVRMVEYLVLEKDATVNVISTNNETPLSITQNETKDARIESILQTAYDKQLARSRWKRAGHTVAATKQKSCTIL